MTQEQLRKEIINRLSYSLKIRVETPATQLEGWPKYGGDNYDAIHEDMCDDFDEAMPDEEVFKEEFEKIVNALLDVLNKI